MRNQEDAKLRRLEIKEMRKKENQKFEKIKRSLIFSTLCKIWKNKLDST